MSEVMQQSEIQGITIDQLPVNNDSKKTAVDRFHRGLNRITVLNDGEVISKIFELGDYYYELTSRMTEFEKCVLEGILKCSANNTIILPNGQMTFVFDIMKVAAIFNNNISHIDVHNAIRSMTGSISRSGVVSGCFIKRWFRDSLDKNIESGSGIVLEYGFVDDIKNAYFVIESKPEVSDSQLNRRKGHLFRKRKRKSGETDAEYLQRLDELKKEEEFLDKTAESYYQVTLSSAWVQLMRDANVVKMANSNSINTLFRIKNRRLNVIANHMVSHDVGVSRTLDHLFDILELESGLKEGSVAATKSGLRKIALGKSKDDLLFLGIEYDRDRDSFLRVHKTNVYCKSIKKS